MRVNPATARKIAAFSLLVLAFLTVAWRLSRRDEELRQVPDTPQSRTAWACEHCGKVYLLTPRDRLEIQKQTEQNPAHGAEPTWIPSEPGGTSSLRDLVLRCPECGRHELRKGVTCPECSTAFPRMVDGKPQVCPKCGWKPHRLEDFVTRPRSRDR